MYIIIDFMNIQGAECIQNELFTEILTRFVFHLTSIPSYATLMKKKHCEEMIMKLTFSQIKEFTTGALAVTKNKHGIHFDRYTDKQVDAFTVEEEILGFRAKTTCGIRIDFHTDASGLSVEVGSLGKYEVMVNGLTAFVQRFEELDCFTIPLGSGEKRVTIVLPSHDIGSIRSIELDGATYVNSHTYARKLAFYGDSITQGWDSEKDSQSYAWLVSRYYDADSMILGVGGARFFPDTVENVGFHAEAVIVALGTNDYGADLSLDKIRNNCAEYLDRIAAIYSGKKLFCITPIWRADEMSVKASGVLSDVREVISEEAAKRNMIIIDGVGMVPHRTEYFADEYLHPNDMGFALYAQNLLKVLNQYL